MANMTTQVMIFKKYGDAAISLGIFNKLQKAFNKNKGENTRRGFLQKLKVKPIEEANGEYVVNLSVLSSSDTNKTDLNGLIENRGASAGLWDAGKGNAEI